LRKSDNPAIFEQRECNVKKNGNGKTHYKFSVYIACSTWRSDLALARLRTICDKTIPNDYEIKVIDLSKNPELARDHQIVATPAIFRILPAPVRKSIGDLIDKEKALLGLNLKQVAAD
jgi:circadian clock protein KaiB